MADIKEANEVEISEPLSEQELEQLTAPEKEKVIWILAADSHLSTLLGRAIQKNDKAGRERHSVEYWCEDLFYRGVNSFINYLDADADRRNKEAFNKEMAALKTPSIDPLNPNFLKIMAEYAGKVAMLKRKYKIGGEEIEIK